MTHDHHNDRLTHVLRSLGQRVHAMRLARGMSVTALSFEAELSEQRIRSLEAGRSGVSLAALVALADVFEVGVADLFGDSIAAGAVAEGADAIDAPSVSPHVVPSPVVWGGELPPAPWLTASESSDEVGRPAPATGTTPPPTGAGFAPGEHQPPAVGAPHIAPGAEVLPPAPWQVPSAAPPSVSGTAHPSGASPDPGTAGPAVPAPPPHAPSVAPRVHQRAAERGMQGASPYVFVAPDAESRGTLAPRTFADLRIGPLAGRNFRSLREFAVASVVEGHHEIPDVARVFRVPAWRLEQWVRESGHEA